jgi:hypothetical protein
MDFKIKAARKGLKMEELLKELIREELEKKN